MIETFYE